MAFEVYDDYEQGERVQKWLRQNGLSIVVGVAIGLVGIFGWQQWSNHKAGRESEASQLYQQVQSAIAGGKNDQAETLTEQLFKDYADSPYAVFAAGDRAVRQANAKQLDKALVSLNWAESHAADPNLKALMQLRIAQLQLAQDKAADAVATLDRMGAKNYEGLSQELRGDALVKLGRPDDARKAYEAAKAVLGVGAPQSGALQLKLDNLAVAGKQGA
ncbi:putative negative regulator of RcsB-dependent stress response [Dyella sp. SG562]|uniref:YfgM family protein n=1 Tax=Dyella TaxID=231454 RepID=UPI001422584E|nr:MULTISPECIES: tetratricopeptide repeat protein [unclassified Dyella]NII75323.1 putative negative regulator of RcsB-dependent stress response [Dyella sp. SG562]NKJ23689.1 putative negative regulator of RcsB-dependent stress response [Dyella sp. SG609]